MLSINPNVSPFGITSCSNFLINFMGSIPLVGAVVGMERIRAAAFATYLEGNVQPSYAKEHCFRGVFEILGVGILLFVTEIVCKILGFLVRLIGLVLLSSIVAAFCFIGLVGSFIVYLLYGVVKLIVQALPLYNQPAQPGLTKAEILAIFSSLAVDVAELIFKSSAKMINASGAQSGEITTKEKHIDDSELSKGIIV